MSFRQRRRDTQQAHLFGARRRVYLRRSSQFVGRNTAGSSDRRIACRSLRRGLDASTVGVAATLQSSRGCRGDATVVRPPRRATDEHGDLLHARGEVRIDRELARQRTCPPVPSVENAIVPVAPPTKVIVAVEFPTVCEVVALCTRSDGASTMRYRVLLVDACGWRRRSCARRRSSCSGGADIERSAGCAVPLVLPTAHC